MFAMGDRADLLDFLATCEKTVFLELVMKEREKTETSGEEKACVDRLRRLLEERRKEEKKKDISKSSISEAD